MSDQASDARLVILCDGERDQLRTEVAAQAYHESHNPCDVCTHMQVEDLVLDVETVTGERDRARDLAAALEAELYSHCGQVARHE